MKEAYKQYRKDIDDYPRLTPEDELRISDLINGEISEVEKQNAINELIVCNLRLVIKVARDVHEGIKNFCRVPPSLMDLIEDGNVGLMKAAARFDISKGKFSSYAYKSIKSSILRKHSNSSNFIRVPPTHYQLIMKIRKVRAEFGKNVSDKIIMEETGINKNQLSNLKCSEESMVSSIEDFFSSDEPDETSNLLDVYVSDEESIHDLIVGEEQRKYITSKIASLSEREQSIINMHFFDGLPVSSKEITEKLQITKQRVHIIYKEALSKLKKMIAFDLAMKDVGLSEDVTRKIIKERETK